MPTFSETLLARVKRLPGVAEASGGVSGTAQLVLKGKTVSFGSSPTLGYSVDPSAPQLSSLKLVSGHWPGAAGVVVDTNTASKKHLKVGQLIGVQADGPVLRVRISGIVKFGSASSLGGTTLTGFTLATAQRLFSKPGQLDTINVAAKSGTSPQQLVDEIKPILPRDAQVRTGRPTGADRHQLARQLAGIPEHAAAGVRRDRAVRRRVRDRQLAVDHDRAAHA